VFWLLMARSSVCILLAVGPALVGAPAWSDPGAEVADPAGDTVDDDTGVPLDVPEADILRSSIPWTTDGIALNVQMRKPTAPLSDKAWDGATEIDWELDTTGDGQADFVADYYTDEGKITGDVYRSTDNPDEPVLCPLRSATFSRDAGYTAVVDVACIGAPQSIAYTAEFSYDTNPDDDAAPVADDLAPDTGMSPRLGIAAPAAPTATSSSPRVVAASPPTGLSVAAPVPAAGRAPAAVPVTAAAGVPADASAVAAAPGPPPLPNTGPSRPFLALAGAALALAGLCARAAGDRKPSR